MKKTFKRTIVSLMAVASLSVSLTGIAAHATSTCRHTGSVSTFTVTCGDTTPYYITAQLKNTSSSTRYCQASIYAGSSLGSLSVKDVSEGAVSAGSSLAKAEKSNISSSYVRCYGYVYSNSSPVGTCTNTYVCDPVEKGNVEI